MDEEKIKCLYYIKDNRNNHIIYIGQTKDFKRRKYEHFGHTRKPVQKYMSDEGRENFSMFPFENIDCTNMSDEEMLNKEDELIQYYDTINNGLNKCRSGLITKEDDYEKYKRTKYYKEHREHVNEYMREYYKEHREHVNEYMREYRKSENWKEYNKEYEKSEKRKEYLKKYQSTEEYKERKREAARRFRAKKKTEKLANDSSL